MKTKKWVTTALMSLVVLSAIGLSGCGNSSTKSSADKDKTAQSSKKTTKKAAKKTYKLGKGTLTYGNLDYSPRYLGHEIASGRSESNVWSVANTD